MANPLFPPDPFPGLGALSSAAMMTSSSDGGQLNPAWTPSQVATIPLDVIMAAYPQLALPSQTPAVPATSSTAPSASSASSASSAPPQQGSTAQERWAPTASPGSKEWKKQMAERDLSTFPNPSRIFFTEAEAKKECPRFGKVFITRDENGDIISEEYQNEIADAVAIQVALIMRVPEEDQEYNGDNIRNFLWWSKSGFLTMLRCAKELALEYPELAWCRNYYKPLKWIERHLKWLVRQQTLAAKAKKEKSKNEVPTSSSSKTSKGKRKQVNDSPSKTKKAKTSASTSARAKDNEFSEDSDAPDEPRKKAEKPKTAVEKLNALAKENEVSDGSDNEVENGEVEEVGALPTVSSLPLKRLSTNIAPLNPPKSRILIPTTEEEEEDGHPASSSSASKVSHRSTASNFKLPVRPSAAASTSTSSALSALSAMRKGDADRLEPPTIIGLRQAISSRFAAIPPSEVIEDTLQTLETAMSCGNDPMSEPDENFKAWLTELENLQGDYTDDEDELGQNFGHKPVGRFAYSTLTSPDSFGSVRNALRLLSALLRIYGIGKAQLRKAGTETLQPIIHNHIRQAAQQIQTAFGLGTSVKKSSAVRQNVTSETDAPSTSTSAPGPSKPRVRVRKELNKGIVSANALKKLTKKAAAELLTNAKINFSGKAKKEEVLAILVKAFETEKITITAAEYYAAKNKGEDSDD
ncbi:hypothetical protein CF326_g5326 [Tilletia indica]|nr:hypothetical protein CF326_g5326 [Tilletia indica]